MTEKVSATQLSPDALNEPEANKSQTRRSKAFTRAELELLVLHLIRLNPTHGYELIKSIGDYSHGTYRPSPGVIYPILTAIEENCLAHIVESSGGRKQYRLSASGDTFLTERADALHDTLGKMKKLVQSQIPKDHVIEGAFEKLKFSVRSLVLSRSLNEAERDKIVDAIIEASEKIRKIQYVKMT